MAWNDRHSYRDTNEAAVLVPRPAARIQNLGPYRTGLDMETDILAGSGLVALAEQGIPLVEEDGTVAFAFEGNANGAVNLNRYHEKVSCAAGRLAHKAPSISYGRARPEDLIVVAGYDLERLVFTEIIDPVRIEAWSGEPLASFIAPKLNLPCGDMDILRPLLELPLDSVFSRGTQALMWRLPSGEVFVMEGGAGLTLHDAKDPRIAEVLETYGAEAHERLRILGSPPLDLSPSPGD